MVAALLHAALIAAALSCQQGERRASAGEVSATLPLHPAPISTPDVDVRSAQVELAEGRAALATKIVMPVLRTPERRTPEAVLVASRAAAEWGGWNLVEAMLAFEPWLDSRFAGEGHELLARSALERGRSTDARPHAEAALRLATEPAARVARLVLLARILDRLELRDSSAAKYKAAADALPLARDWLLLRTAGVTGDRARRERLYAGVWSVAARERVPYTEAQALERFNMAVAAANAYEKLGDLPSAYRLRISASPGAAQRKQLRARLLRLILTAEKENVGRAIEVLDAAYPQLDASAQLAVARRAAAFGLAARAVAGFSKVPPRALKDDDVIAWARALIATDRSREAARRLAARRFSPAAAAEADYVRAHALLRAGSPTAARGVLRHILETHKATRASADAAYLLADLESDAGRESNARTMYDRACTHRPSGSYSDEACFRSGILSFALKDAARAAKTFEDLASRFPNSSEAAAATYWSGRAWQRAGNDSLARDRWRSMAGRQRLSYYGAVSARRLGEQSWIPTAPELHPTAAYTGGLARALVLEQLGMDVEKRYEYESIERDAIASPSTALSVGATLLERGEAQRAIRLGWRIVEMARDSGSGDERGYALVYPLLRRDGLLENSRLNKLDPAVVAAVIRQESSWNPRAVSGAGARGLMQVMPPVGRQLAQSKRYPVWDPALLFDPDVSLELGTFHLRAALSQSSNLPRALAAYNAGASRVQRWVRRLGADDPELFIERIPFVETRDYVRIVMRNAELYRALYGLSK
jgi:peptidoglycan lytic transglycosylase